MIELPTGSERWILGNNFLRGYYSTHDYTTHQFGLVPLAGSSKSALVAGTVPEEPLTEWKPYDLWINVTVSILGAIFVGLIIWALVWLYCPVKKKKDGEDVIIDIGDLDTDAPISLQSDEIQILIKKLLSK